MKLLKLELKNYKSHKHFVAELDGLNKLIQGNKGSGKTSVKDAYSWLMTGRMVDDPTPVDEKGVLINHLTISVSCEFDDGTTLMIEDSQKWVKDVLKSNHSATYYVNGTPCLEKDYQSFLDSKFGTLEQRKIMIDPEFFAYGDGLKVAGKTPKTAIQRRREIVISVAGAEDTEAAIEENEDKAKRAKFSLSTFKKQLDDAYAGVESLNDAKVDTNGVDYAVITDSISLLEKEKTSAIKSLESLNSSNDTQNTLQRALSDAQTKFSQEQSKYMQESNERMAVARKPYDEYIAKKQDLESKYQQAQFSKLQQDKEKNILVQDAEELENKIAEKLNEYKVESSQVYVPNSTMCQNCGQSLPTDKLLSAEAVFNKHKSDKLESILNYGKTLREELEVIKLKLDQPIKDFGLDLLENELKSLVEPSVNKEKPWENTSMYVECVNAIENAKKALENNSDDEAKSIYDRTINSLNEQIQELQLQLNVFETNKHIESQIVKKEHELQSISASMDEQKDILDECNEFTRKTLEALQKSLEDKFPNIRFKMFEYTLDGTQKDTCITFAKTPNGYIPWESLSGGQKRSATISLANAFNKVWNVSTPLFIDDTQIYSEDALDASMQLIRITEVPNAQLEIK